MEPNDFHDPWSDDLSATPLKRDSNPYTTPHEVAEDAEPPATPIKPRLPHPNIGWAIVWVLGFWLFQVIVSLGVILALVVLAFTQGKSAPAEMMESLEEASVATIPIGTGTAMLFAAAVAWLFYRREFSRRLALRGMSLTQWIAVLLSMLPMAILASEITNCAGEVLPQFTSEILEQFASGPFLLVLVSACLFPAVGEEILCRGFLGRGLVAHHGPFFGVLLASLLFGIMHIDPVQATGAFSLGLGLHFVYLTTRSLVAPIVIHLLNNAFAFVLIRNYETYPILGLTPDSEGNMSHTPPLMIALAVACVACLSAVLVRARTRWISEDGTEWTPGYATAEQPPRGATSGVNSSHPHVALALLTLIVYGGLLWAIYLAHQSAVDQALKPS